MTIAPAKHTFTVDEYHRMGEAGILSEDDRVELIEGEIVDMTPIGDRHISAVDRLNELFSQALAGRVIVRVQNPIRLGERNEPQPDIVLLRRRDDFYARGPAGPGESKPRQLEQRPRRCGELRQHSPAVRLHDADDGF